MNEGQLSEGQLSAGRLNEERWNAVATWRIVADDLTHPQVLTLLDLHLRAANENSPSGCVFALDLSGLQDPSIRLWTLWQGDLLLGMGGLKQLDAVTGEVKSMRTAPGQQRRGVARAMLAHLIAEARASGWATLKLETGASDAFAAARALYEQAGFRRCAAFGDYGSSDFNRCYALLL